MAEQWYYAQQGQRKGPVSEQEIRQLISSSQLQPTDLVWKQGMAQWAKASEFFPPSSSDPNASLPLPLPQLQNRYGKPLALLEAVPGESTFHRGLARLLFSGWAIPRLEALRLDKQDEVDLDRSVGGVDGHCDGE